MQNWRDLEVFKSMSAAALNALEGMTRPVRFAPGDVILRQGEPGSAMFLLDRGRVRVEVTRKDGSVFHTELAAPVVFGEMALVTQAPRTATVVALEDCACLRLERESFDEVVAQNPRVAVFLTAAVGRRLLEEDGITAVGKYRVTGRLGAGGAATVFEAVQPELDHPVALKMLSHSLVLHPGFAEQFRREARMVAALEHDHVVRVLDTEYAYGTHFIVMERLKGELLEEMIQSGRKLPWPTIRKVLLEVLDALQFAHGKGLLHRDIKPSNIFYTDQQRAKILDFGIAVEVGKASGPKGQRLGTPYYMSPEQVMDRPLDGRTDLYSLGIMAYEMITGEVPFDGDTLPELLQKQIVEPLPDPRVRRPDTPPDLVEFLWRTCAKRPDDRFATAADAAKILRVHADLPIVDRIGMVTLGVTYHPSLEAVVARALDRLEDQLAEHGGIRVVRAQQGPRGGE